VTSGRLRLFDGKQAPGNDLSSSVSIEESSLQPPLARQRQGKSYAEPFLAARKVSRAAMLPEQERLLGGAPQVRAECRLV